MKRQHYVTMIAVGMAGMMGVMSGCSGQPAAATEAPTTVEATTVEETAEEETTTVEETAATTSEEASEVQGAEVGLMNGGVPIMTVPGGKGSPELQPGGPNLVEGDLEVYVPLVDPEGSDIDKMAGDAPLRIWGVLLSAGDDGILAYNQANISSPGEMIFHIDPENTFVLDAQSGFPVEMADVQLGSFEAYLGPIMSMSLPPQTTPYVVIVNIPEGFRAPQYVVAADKLGQKDGKTVLSANDGREYAIADNAAIQPYLTRNIVAMEDIKESSRCLVWLNDDNEVESIVLFAE